MQYTTLGNSGLKVSKIAFGTGNFFETFFDEIKMRECLDYAWERGINTFDTADVYGRCETQKFLSSFLNTIDREDVVISTKVGNRQRHSRYNGLSRKHIFDSVNKSLKELNLEYIDILCTHAIDFETDLLETVTAFNDLIKQGKIMHYGLGNIGPYHFEQAIKLIREHDLIMPVYYQTAYSLAEKEEGGKVLEICKKENLGLMAAAPLHRGLLSGKYIDDAPNFEYEQPWPGSDTNLIKRALKQTKIIDQMNDLKKYAESLGATNSQLAFAWLLFQENVDIAIMGAKNKQQIDEILKALEIKLSNEQFNIISSLVDNVSWSINV